MRFLEPIARRPAMTFALTMAAAMATPANPTWLLLAAAITPLLPGWSPRAIALAGLILGLVLAPSPPGVVADARGVFAARVATLPRSVGGGASFIAELGSTRLASWAPSVRPAMGDRILATGETLPLQRGPDDYLISRGVSGRLRIRSLRVLSHGPAWSHAVAGLSRSFGERLRARLGERRGTLAAAIAFNLDGELDPETDAALRRSGAYHLVSASGLHAALLAGVLGWAGARLPIPRAASIVAAGAILLAYCVLTGWHAATVRAALMWGAGSAAYLFGRLPDALSALGTFVAAWLALNPLDLYDVGFGLTVAVTAAILGFRTEGPLRWRDLATGLVAWIAAEPIAAMAFGRVTPLALPANIAMAAASEVVLVLAALVALPPFGFLSGLASACVDGLMAIARAFGRPAWAYLPTPWMTPALAGALEIGLLVAWLGWEARRAARRPR